MKITGLSVQVRDKQRVNVMVDGAYGFSLDITQVAELGLKTGDEYDESQLRLLEEEATFGKLYTRSLEYALVRPRSEREIRDYLYRKTRPRPTKKGNVAGVSEEIAERVRARLVNKGYVNDEIFARYWVENRNLRKGTSQRRLRAELVRKGVRSAVIDRVLGEGVRDEHAELRKVIERKRARYDDERKLIAYLVGQGFSYDNVKEALASEGDE